MIYTKLSLKKLTDKPVPGNKMPSHSIIAATDDYKEKVNVGKLWLKAGEWGYYLSGELNKENRTYQKKDGTQGEEFAYVIMTRDEYNKLVSPSVKVGGYEGEVATGEVPVADIPF
jgi:hypothetical protein